MKIARVLDDVEQLVQDRLTRKIPVDRFILLDWLEQEINTLGGMADFDFLAKPLGPLIVTQTGKRGYMLPDDFPENFLRGADSEEERYVCKLNDGTTEFLLSYLTIAQFYSRQFEDEAVNKPSVYTILTTEGGTRELQLAPPPDSNSDSNYTINGIYIPSHWHLQEEDQVPPIPGNAAVLRYALLRRVNPGNAVWQQEYERQRNYLLFRASVGRQSQVTPG